MKKRVVITGMGFVTPLGCRLEKTWTRLCNGESGITLLPENFASFRARFAGQSLDYTDDPRFPPKEGRKIERFVQMALSSAIDAVEMAGLDLSREDREKCGAVIGCGVGGLGEIEHQQDRLRSSGPNRVSPLTIPKIMGNAAAGNVSIHYGLTGPAYGVVTACASANNAMIDAYKMIRDGELSIVITGGTESACSELGMSGFAAMRALSERNDAPERASRPFDRDRDGFVLSEGAGILIFEELSHAQARGANILGEFLGFGVTSDATHITQPDSEGVQAARAIRLALQSARLLPENIDYINAHGTSTLLGDIAETAAIKSAFGEAVKNVSISGTKSAIGHLLGGSGAVELIFSLLTIRDGVIPPTINLENPDPKCDLDFTPLVAREKKVSRILSNSFGFGGHNACVIAGAFRE